MNRWLASPSSPHRLLALAAVYWTVFLSCVILSHLFLPEGLLRRYSEGRGGAAMTDFSQVFLQLLLFNLISMFLLSVASLFAKRKIESQPYLPVSVSVLLCLATLNGLVLGTNSFSLQTTNTGLFEKTIGLLNLSRYSAVWEISALILLATALFNKNLVLTTGKTTQTQRVQDWHWSRGEWLTLALSFAFLVIGAMVEARRIVQVG